MKNSLTRRNIERSTERRAATFLFSAVIGLSSAVAFAASPSPASSRGEPPLFSKGAENFKLQKTDGRPVQFVVLNGSPSERALATAIATTLNAQPETQPKIPVNGQLNLNLEKLTITPIAGKPKELEVSVRVSGHDLTLPRTLDRETFLSGRLIEMNFPPEEKSLTGFTVESTGKLKFRFDKAKSEVSILNAEGKVKYDTILGDNGVETVRFSGRGVRQIQRL